MSNLSFRSGFFCFLFLPLATATVWLGCADHRTRDPYTPPIAEPLSPEVEEAAARHLEGWTEGLLAPRQELSVRFALSVVSDELVGSEPARPLVEIDHPGNWTWASTRELRFRPAADWPTGKLVSGRIRLDLALGEEALPAVKFRVTRAPLRLTFVPAGLHGDGSTRELRGDIVALPTPSAKDLAGIRAEQDGRRLDCTVDRPEGSVAARLSCKNARLNGHAVRILWDGADGKTEGFLDVPMPERPEHIVIQSRRYERHGDRRTLVLHLSSAPPRGEENFLTLKHFGAPFVPRMSVQGNRIEASWLGSQSRSEVALFTIPGNPTEEIALQALDGPPIVRWRFNGDVLPLARAGALPIVARDLREVEIEVRLLAQSAAATVLRLGMSEHDNGMRLPGRVLLRRLVQLGPEGDGGEAGAALDLRALFEAHPSGVFELVVRGRQEGKLRTCPTDDGGENEYEWNDPCNPWFWRWYPVQDRRRVVVSDLGMMSWKAAGGALQVVTTSLPEAGPWSGVTVRLFDETGEQIDEVRSDAQGRANFTGGDHGQLVVAHAEKDGRTHTALINLENTAPRSLASFDVGGIPDPSPGQVWVGLDRGVVRPGDSLFAVAVARSPDGGPWDRHPLEFVLRDPRGRVVSRRVAPAAAHGLHGWRIGTSPDDAPGPWTVEVLAGPVQRSATALLEHVDANRILVRWDTAAGPLRLGENSRLNLSAIWMHGAPASDLPLRAEMRLRPSSNWVGPRARGFVLSDPTRTFPDDLRPIASASLDEEGKIAIELPAPGTPPPPGMLEAEIRVRVEEPGGRASTEFIRMLASPFSSYAALGIEGLTWNWIEAGNSLALQFESFSPEGQRLSGRPLQLQVFHNSRGWWWEGTSGRQAMDFMVRTGTRLVESRVVTAGTSLDLPVSSSGQWLLLLEDPASGHRAGQFFSVWGDGDGLESVSERATPALLELVAQSPSVRVGQQIGIRFSAPEGTHALIHVLQGDRVLQGQWVKPRDGQIDWSTKATPEMVPGVHVEVSLLRPHPSTDGRPLRLYGVIPIDVQDPSRRLDLAFALSGQARPRDTLVATVRDRQGRQGRVWIAAVDEGWLRLTGHRPPDPRPSLDGRRALEVVIHDLFDRVVRGGASTFERVHPIGGDGAERSPPEPEPIRREEAMVRAFGPLDLTRQGTEVRLPLEDFTGRLRLMAVAVEETSLGAVDTAITVRAPLHGLLDLPPRLRPTDTALAAVAAWSETKGSGMVDLGVRGAGQLVGTHRVALTLDPKNPAVIRAAIAAGPDTGALEVTARLSGPGGPFPIRIGTEVVLETPRSFRRTAIRLDGPGPRVLPLEVHGKPGTFRARLMASPPGMGAFRRHLERLSQQPYGCLEQVVSASMASLWIRRLMPRTDDLRLAASDLVVAEGLDLLRSFRVDQGLSMWPREEFAWPWGTLWALQFILDARELHHRGAAGIEQELIGIVSRQASTWRGGGESDAADTLRQAMRLDLMARMGRPDLAAMELLRVRPLRPVSAWILAAAWARVGRSEIARTLAEANPWSDERAVPAGWTALGSPLRDLALVVAAAEAAGLRSRVTHLAQRLREVASDPDRWLSTQEAAALARALALHDGPASDGNWRFFFRQGSGKWNEVQGTRGMLDTLLVSDGGDVEVDLRTGRGIEVVLETEALDPQAKPFQMGIEVSASWTNLLGLPINPMGVPEGTPLMGTITVRNPAARHQEGIAVRVPVPAGWELRNPRVEGQKGSEGDRPRRFEIHPSEARFYDDLGPHQTRSWRLYAVASRQGSWSWPGVQAEAMYDPGRVRALGPSRRVRVVPAQ